jgi:hypothetical protein
VQPLLTGSQQAAKVRVLGANQSETRKRIVQTVKYVSWEEDGGWLGYLQDYSDYWTQSETLEDLKEHLRDLYADLTKRSDPGDSKSR